MGLQKYHNTNFSRTGGIQMWTLHLSSRSQYVCNSIKTFDFSTLYTTISHTLLKSRITDIIDSALLHIEERRTNIPLGVC